jgi:prepilin-type N-terminal cleavage/methylation domain-containing protein
MNDSPASRRTGVPPVNQAKLDPHSPLRTNDGRDARPTTRARRGLTIIELLVSLAITAMLLTATMVAIDASFRAYASAAESASTQTSTRLVVHRLLTMVRTSTAHGPLLEETGVTRTGDTLDSPYIELLDQQGNLIRIDYTAAEQTMYVTTTPAGGSVSTRVPMLGGVTQCNFHLTRRLDDDGIWVLARGSIDFTVQPDDDASLELEMGQTAPIRVVASTMPRRLD